MHIFSEWTIIDLFEWLFFSAVVIILLLRILKVSNIPKIDYAINIELYILVFALISFILIWGGIFWW